MLLCGAAKLDINPDFPIHLMGYRHDLVSNAVHDDIHVTALYLKQGDAQVAVLAYDMININAAFVEEVQKAGAEAAGLPPARSSPPSPTRTPPPRSSPATLATTKKNRCPSSNPPSESA